MVTIIPGDETVYTVDDVPRPHIKISHNFADALQKEAGRITNDATIIAHIPAGILSESIVNKIMFAYAQKGSTLTLEEVMPFYEEDRR
jgi:hypothetical protein